MKSILDIVVSWLAGFIIIVGSGYLVFQHLTAWAALVQLAYVVPVMLLADRRSGMAFGLGVLCGAAVVFALNTLAGVFMFVFGAEP
jgi:hypothetical protein